MRRNVVVKSFIIFMIFGLLFGCSNTNVDKKIPESKDNQTSEKDSKGSHQLAINLNLLNPSEEKDTYYVFLVVPGQKEIEPGKATQSGMSKPFETDKDGKVTINLEDNYDLQFLID